jgi:predicted transcriptional regulator of viral defense system
MGNNTILKRLGYILHVTGLLDQYADQSRGFRPSAGFTKLDPLSPRSGKHDTHWGLLVNFRLDPEGWRY